MQLKNKNSAYLSNKQTSYHCISEQSDVDYCFHEAKISTAEDECLIMFRVLYRFMILDLSDIWNYIIYASQSARRSKPPA